MLPNASRYGDPAEHDTTQRARHRQEQEQQHHHLAAKKVEDEVVEQRCHVRGGLQRSVWGGESMSGTNTESGRPSRTAQKKPLVSRKVREPRARVRAREASASSQNEAEESDEAEDDGQGTTRVGRSRGSTGGMIH